MKYENVIEEMEGAILKCLSELEPQHGYRKSYISKHSGIPIDVLTVLLKRLKYAGKIELTMIWSEETCLPDGSGYCLAGNLEWR